MFIESREGPSFKKKFLQTRCHETFQIKILLLLSLQPDNRRVEISIAFFYYSLLLLYDDGLVGWLIVVDAVERSKNKSREESVAN